MKKLFFLFATACIAFNTGFSQTFFHGGIYSNTTWTLANSPYIITDTVVVFPNVTLTIQPGVIVKFDSNVYMEVRQGNLIANGTPADSITFTSNTAHPNNKSWKFILMTAATTLSFNYCNF